MARPQPRPPDGDRPGTRVIEPLPGTRAQSPHRRQQMLSEGVTERDLRDRLRSGALDPVGRGIYLRRSAERQWKSDRYRAHILGVAATMPPDAVISHQSAAALMGLPLWKTPLDRVHFTRPVDSGTHRTAGMHVHAEPRAFEVASIGALPVTTAERTLVDCARSLPFEQAVVMVDAALHAGLVTRDQLQRELARIGRKHGARSARSVVAFADGRSESVGESRSRVLLSRGGLLPSDLQYPVLNRRGHAIARADFAYADYGVIAEFDGRVKYGRLVPSGATPSDVLFAEKRREDEIRELGWLVVRWVWAELDDPGIILARLRRVLRADRRGIVLPG